MDQPTLTEFFSTRKRPVEGVHPAKRRKLIESDSVVAEPAKTVRNVERRVKATLTTKPRQSTTRTTRAKAKQNEALRNDVRRVFLRSEMKKASEESKCATSEVTSVSDEHAVANEATPSLNEANERKRKTRAENAISTAKKSECNLKLDTNSDKECLEAENSKKEAEKQETKPRVSKGRSRGRTKKQNEIQEVQELTSLQNDDSVKDQDSAEGDKPSNQTDSKPETPTKLPSKTSPAVRRNQGSLKINPWISEQAKNVLLSRGQAALLLSQQKQANVLAGGKSKTSEDSRQKVKVTGKGLSKAKAQEGLEKARELIKNMRALETSAARAKGSSTADKPERLHEVAKRQSTETTATGVSSPKKAPAHERLHSLALPTPPSSGKAVVTLPLPYKYKVLGEMFNSCDTVLNLLGQRHENCTFAKLKDAVQEMCRKRFEKKHLAQIVHLMPSAFDVKQARVSLKSSTYEINIQFGPLENSTATRMNIPMTELLERKKTFQNALLVVTKKHHQTFLQSLETPLTVEDDKIIRWHPQFKLDDVPDIQLGTLPEAPVIKTYTTAKDVLEKTRGMVPSKVEKALFNAAKKADEPQRIGLSYSTKPSEPPKSTGDTTSTTVPTSFQPKPPASRALKGVSQDLLDKIRKKQARKLEEDLMRDPVLDKKISMRERLPELCRILKTYFSTEKKAAIPLEDAVQKLSESYTSSLSAEQVKEHINLLSTLVPEWVAVLTIRKCPYVKINKKADINSVINKVMKTELL